MARGGFRRHRRGRGSEDPKTKARAPFVPDANAQAQELRDLDGVRLVHFASGNGLSTWLDRALDSDGVIHLAFVVPSVTETAARTDAAAIETFAAGLAGSGRPMLISGATIVTPGRRSTERDELIAEGRSPPT